LSEARERELKQVQKALREVGVREQSMREELARLERLHGELVAAQKSHDDWAKRLREQAMLVEEAVNRLGEDRDGQLRNLRARLDAVASELEELARQEVGDTDLLQAPELAQLQAKLINEAKRFAPLSDDDYKRIWRETKKDKS
jgi:chromosome segregation ATPase